jgi:hypothetical protein
MKKNYFKNAGKYCSRGNGEYVLLFGVLMLIGLGIYSSIGVPQVPEEQINLSTMYPNPTGRYDQEVKAQLVLDWDNVYNFLDPFGASVFTDVRVTGDLLINGKIFGSDTSNTYYINLNIGEASVRSLMTSGRITMGAATPPPTGPDGVPIGGKHVWDIAEGMPAASDCESADVVLISEDASEMLVKSREKFSTRIAGVISEEPKLCLGVTKDTKPLALAGIVRCNVTAENGPIKKGDMLVSSSEPGSAMRADARDVMPGMLVGSALESLERGKSKIYILVNQ